MITKEEVASAFERHFHHFGFRKTAVDDVARELKISKKTIYSVFESKEAIFQYLVDRNARQILSQFSHGLAVFSGPAARIEALIRMIFAQAVSFAVQRDPLDFHFQIAEKAFRAAYCTTLEEIIREGVQADQFEPAPVEITVSLLDGLIAAGLRLVIEDPAREDFNDEVISNVVASAIRIVVR